MTEVTYLKFDDISSPKKKTKDFAIWSGSDSSFLGYIKWRSGWRKYVFVTPDTQAVFDNGCLQDICEFLNKLMEKRKELNQKKVC